MTLSDCETALAAQLNVGLEGKATPSDPVKEKILSEETDDYSAGDSFRGRLIVCAEKLGSLRLKTFRASSR